MSCLHRGPYIQRGRGIGSSLTAMFKDVVPALKLIGEKVIQSPVTKEIVKAGKRAAIDVATDVLRGKKLKSSISENVDTAKKAVSKSLVSALEKAKETKIGNKSVVKKTGGKRDKKHVILPIAQKSVRKKSKAYDIFRENFG